MQLQRRKLIGWGALVLVLALALPGLAIGCSIPGIFEPGVDYGDPDITGLIYSAEEDQILVVAGIERVDIPYAEWFEGGKEAIQFRITEETVLQDAGGEELTLADLARGQAVEAWADGALMESYPARGDARRVVVLQRDVAAPENGPDDHEEEAEEEPEEGMAPGAQRTASLLRGLGREAETGMRPRIKDLTVFLNGGTEEQIYRLLNLSTFPFSTYIPGQPDTSPYFLLGPGHLQEDDPSLSRMAERVLVGRSGPGGGQLDELEVALEVIFFRSEVTRQEAWAQLDRGFEDIPELQELPGELPAWVQEARFFSREGDRAGFLVLGRQAGQYFGLRATWQLEQETAWLSLLRPVLEQWTWEEQVSRRPGEQYFTTFPEGMEDLSSYCLVERPDFPLSTYFPCDRQDQVQEIDAGSARGLRLGYMDIMFLDEDLERRGAEASFHLALSYMGALDPVPTGEHPPWALEMYAGRQNHLALVAILAEHDGRYFYIREEYPAEAGDGWHPLRNLIFDQWRWQDSGEPLEQP